MPTLKLLSLYEFYSNLRNLYRIKAMTNLSKTYNSFTFITNIQCNYQINKDLSMGIDQYENLERILEEQIQYQGEECCGILFCSQQLDINIYIYLVDNLFNNPMRAVTNFIDGIKGSVTIDVILDKKEDQKYFKVKPPKGQKYKLPIYCGNDDISGIVKVELKDTKKYEHLGIKVMLVGYLEIFSDKNLSTEFHSLAKELEPAGFLTQSKQFRFKFPNFEKQYETFNGIAGRVRYFIRAIVNRNMKTTVTKQVDFAVVHYNSNVEETETETQMKMEVGIQDCLHIEFEFNKHFYHLKDVILGRVLFHLVKIKIKFMEINLVRKEIFGTGSTTKTETETLVKYEVMDGCPDKDETVPIRMYMNGVQLTPSYKNIHNRLQVKYSINLVLVDEEDRRYFKQTEIIVYRKPA